MTLTPPPGATPGPMLLPHLVGGHIVLQDAVGAAFGHAINAHHVLRLGRPHHHAVHPRRSRHRHDGTAFKHDTIITPLRSVPYQFLTRESVLTVIPYSRNGTNALAGALAEVVNAIRPLALSATTPITDPRSAAMVIVEREEGFSDEDFASAARCIVASAELATTYVALKSQGTRTALIRGTMEMYQSSK
ncbi:hypothetical protein BJY52DRAFT_1224612 [Lactarius psammicola]|nr:hypothetical protein BJY52DRAFT_1224612 [Lactarius psammicola]